MVKRRFFPGKVLLIIGLILVIGATVYFNLSRQAKEAPVLVQTARVEEKDLVSTVFATGRVEALGKQEIYAESNSLLTEFTVKTGDLVEAGQVLARLEQTSLENRLEEALAGLNIQEIELAKLQNGPRSEEIAREKAALTQAELELKDAQKKLERTRQLFEQEAATRIELEEAEREAKKREANYQAAKAGYELLVNGPSKEEVETARARMEQARVEVKSIRQQIEKTVLRAGQRGTVLICNGQKGSYVSPGALLFVIGNSEQLEINADIAESDSGLLAPSQKVGFSCPAQPQKEYRGVISRVAPTAAKSALDEAQQTSPNPAVAVKIKPLGSTEGLRPGYTVDLTITTKEIKKAVVVPYEALVEKDKKQAVFVVKEGRARYTLVKTDPGNELYLQVRQGVKKGEKVIINPPKNLRPGQTVKENEKEK
ncbi:MAG: efflux RND transporter periplasmic adaptor subunit [Peptococcaceae bacterium]